MTTTARFGGICPECREPFTPGTDITRDIPDSPWRHATCPDPLTPSHPVCTTCWLDHPEGACDR